MLVTFLYFWSQIYYENKLTGLRIQSALINMIGKNDKRVDRVIYKRIENKLDENISDRFIFDINNNANKKKLTKGFILSITLLS